MREAKVVECWAVYQTVQGTLAGMKSVCEQSEWEALTARKPGVHALIRGGIISEGEADRLARGTAGDAKPRSGKNRLSDL